MNIFKPTITTLLLFTLLTLALKGTAQNVLESCGTFTTKESIQYYNSLKPQLKKAEKAYIQQAFSKNSSKTKHINSIPVKAHIIRPSNGLGGLCESDLNTAIANLNSIYADAFMEFILCDGINYINEDALCHLTKGDEKSLIETNNIAGVINIYFVDNIVNDVDESLCGYSDNEGRNDVIVINNSCVINNSSLAHEIGHFFSLIHTHGADSKTLTTEFVDGSNCDTDGDGICDTPADPKLTSKNVNNFCKYIGEETDAHGDVFTPDTGNIMSYSMKGCRNHFTPQQLARMHAFYMIAKNYLACPSFNADFTTNISQTCDNQLAVNFKSNCTNITKWEWDIDSDGSIDYTTQNPTHTFTSGIYDVTLTVSNKSKSISKTFSKLIKVGNSISLFNEDFEKAAFQSDLNWTTNDVTKNGYNWLLNTGKTPSDTTGPTKGTYMYAEATGAKPGDISELISPCINVDNKNSEIEFSYHMFGKNIGELHIDLKTESGYINDVIPALIGNQQKNQEDDFKIENIDLSAYAFQTINLRFRAIRGTNWDGDIAIDNVFIKTIDVPIYSDVKLYPNPVSGELLYVNINNTDEVFNFEISNLTGKVFKTGILTNQPINVGNLSSGMYLFTIIGQHSKVTRKIIK